MSDEDVPELTETEREALHKLQLASEHMNRAFGHLVSFHHAVGRGMDRMMDAEAGLREAGHEEFANELRDVHLPAGIIDDKWSYEIVEAFEDEFFDEIMAFEQRVRDELADGMPHVTEREQQQEWRERRDR